MTIADTAHSIAENLQLTAAAARRQQILAEVPAGSTWQTREDAWSLTRKHKQHLPPAARLPAARLG